jgi:hypothetical protein
MNSEMDNQEGGRRHRRSRTHKQSKKSLRGGKSRRRHAIKSHKRRKTARRH